MNGPLDSVGDNTLPELTPLLIPNHTDLPIFVFTQFVVLSYVTKEVKLKKTEKLIEVREAHYNKVTCFIEDVFSYGAVEFHAGVKVGV